MTTQDPDRSAVGTDPQRTATDSAVDPAATTDGLVGASVPPLPDAVWRYALGEEIGHGGMGVVYRSTDAVFTREVAVKVLQDRFAVDSGAARRFADEARITGQLQHPAIPAVHDLGTLPDGRPFLAMKLIRGNTLEDLLAGRPDLEHGRGRFVAAFEQVCQAVAYAHARQVIHRDLKPANIMLGNYGEVQVMDWGLAKVLATAARADPEQTAIQSLRDSDGAFTQAGLALGTPAFMPPEQALGAVGKIDARSDVFGLGAVLAVVLTGKPPFDAGSAETIRMQSAQGKLDDCFARLDRCGADPDLVALCKRCLSPSPADRPADGGEVAQEVARLRAAADERARLAELQRVQAEGEKVAAQLQTAELKKRRRVQLALFAALTVLLLGSVVVAWRQNAQAEMVRQRQQRNAEALAALLEQNEQDLRSGDVGRVTLSLEAAQKRAAEGGAEHLAGLLERRQKELALLRELAAVEQFRWTPLGSRFPEPALVAARNREALGHFGADPDAVSPDVVATLVADSALRERIITAFDLLLRQQRTAGVRAVLQAVDPDPFRDAVRDAERAANLKAIAELAGRPAALQQPPEFAAFLGSSLAVDVPRRRQLLEAAISRRPSDSGLLIAMGNTYPFNTPDGSSQRLRWFQAAVAAAPNNRAAHLALGNVLSDNNDLSGAEAAYRQALLIDPTFALAHHNLGNVLRLRKDFAAAEAAYRRAIHFAPKYATAYLNLGLVLKLQKKQTAAEAAYRDAIRVDPLNAAAYNNLGNLLRNKKDFQGAETAFRSAIRLNRNFAPAHFNLGMVLSGRKDYDGAESALREAIRSDPRFAQAHSSLGSIRETKGDIEGAIAAYKKALRIDPKDGTAVENLPQAERTRQLLPRLPAILAGQAEPKDPAEACEFAQLCCQPFLKRHLAAVHLFEQAFAADAGLANNLKAGFRYDAACSALTAAGGGAKDSPPEAAGRAILRDKALNWLRADLALCRKQADSADSAPRNAASALLTHWLDDAELAGIREANGQDKLPPAERRLWQKLWADVRTTLALAQKPPPPPERLPLPRIEK